jgi:hypothetical protein
MSTSSAGSEAFRSQHLGFAGAPSPSVKSIQSACESSNADLIITAGFPCQDLSPAGRKAGLSGAKSSLGLRLIGLLSKIHITVGARGCPSCGASLTLEGIPACRFECEPLTLGLDISEPEDGWLPTPTASAYGSCRGGGAGRVGKWRPSLHSLGILHPEDWERMMGYPIGWTDATRSETQSCLRQQS